MGPSRDHLSRRWGERAACLTLNAGGPIPPVQIQNVNVVRLEFGQAVPQTDMKRALVVAGVVDRLALTVLLHLVAGGELGGNDHEVTVLLLLHPLSNPLFRLLILVVVGSVDEVAAGSLKGVEQLEAVFLAHAAHEIVPGISNAHGAQLEGRHSHTGSGRQDSVAAQRGGWCRCRLEHGGHDGEV